MDFYAGSRDPANHLLHLRTAMLDMNWGNTTSSFGQDKPIFAPREPDSLAKVGVSPLTAAGNLWDWQPQVRIEQRVHFGESAGLTAQAGSVPDCGDRRRGSGRVSPPRLSTRGRAIEGRFDFWARAANRRD